MHLDTTLLTPPHPQRARLLCSCQKEQPFLDIEIIMHPGAFVCVSPMIGFSAWSVRSMRTPFCLPLCTSPSPQCVDTPGPTCVPGAHIRFMHCCTQLPGQLETVGHLSQHTACAVSCQGHAHLPMSLRDLLHLAAQEYTPLHHLCSRMHRPAQGPELHAAREGAQLPAGQAQHAASARRGDPRGGMPNDPVTADAAAAPHCRG